MRLSVILAIVAAVLAVVILAYVGLLRPWHLRWGTTSAEVAGILSGDALIPAATNQVTRAITINAPPAKIWTWLMQIGQDRSGFYSYTPLENLIGAKMPEVHELRAGWPPRSVGETVWFGDPQRFNGQAKMIAALVDPPRTFVMVSPVDWQKISVGGNGSEVSWGFYLVPIGPSRTRLIARLRYGTPPTLGSRIVNSSFWEPSHFLMEQKMLRTLKELAERP